MRPAECKEEFIDYEQTASFPLSMTLKPRKELLNPRITRVVPYEQLSNNQKRAAQLSTTLQN